MAGSALQSGGHKPEVGQSPERKSRFHAALSNRPIVVAATRWQVEN